MAGFWNANLYAPQTLASDLAEASPQATYYRALGLGTGGDPRSRFLRSAFPEFYQQYLGEVPFQPDTFRFVDDLAKRLPGLETQFRNLPPEQRGLEPGKFSGPVRWLL